jgi:translation initiation factor IF-2
MTEVAVSRRLSKIAKEFNIATTTIVDFLKTKNIELESNPNAKISDEAYVLLQEKFQADKIDKGYSQTQKEEKKEEKYTEPISQIDEAPEILIKSNIYQREREAPPKIIKTEVPRKEEKKEEIPAIKEEIQIIPEVVEQKLPEEIQSKEVTELKIIGKIDLPGTSKPKKIKKEPEPISEPEVKKEELVIEPETIAEIIPEEPQKEDIPVIEEPEEIIIIERNERDILRDKEKEENTLAGLKIVGKIDVDSLESEKHKKKPIASSSDPSSISSRRRRRVFSKKGKESDDKGHDDKKARVERKEVKKDRFERKKPDKKKEDLDDKIIKDQITQTLAKLTSKQQTTGLIRAKIKKKQKKEQREKEHQANVAEQTSMLEVIEFITANELANLMRVSVAEVITTCLNLGLMISINQRLDAETITIVADEFGYDVKFTQESIDEPMLEEADNPKRMKERAPVVTIMGHVDHGKTSLLDYIRKSRVTEGEAGGITQHIGAYSVSLTGGKRICFLDTPGHEAFTSMRARGAKVTDLVIVVIAADDSVMPQTREAISHAQAAGVPIVFALNKIDKAGANPEKIREQLADMNMLVEEWGGKYQSQEISAKKGQNVDLLLEKVLLEAEMLELKADASKRAAGTIIEASLDKGKGIVANILIQKGSLKVGDPILAGAYYGKVKALFDERGKKVANTGPSTPIEVLGFDGSPTAGDKFYVTETEQQAKEIATQRKRLLREQGIRATKHLSLEEIGRRIALGNFKELNIIIKGDVDGSVEALSDSLQKLSNEEVQVNVIHKGVGQISESDVLLASASDAIIIGFQVRPSLNARKMAEQEQIEIRTYTVIYTAIEELKLAIEGLLAPEEEEKILCNVEIRDVFKITKVGTVAGCMVVDGRLARSTKIRVIREGVIVFTGELSSLKRFKEDVREVTAGYECGMGILNYNDIKVGDIVEGFSIEQIKRKL